MTGFNPYRHFLSRYTNVGFPDIILNLLDVFSHIFIADISQRRGKGTRILKVEVPVTNPVQWEKSRDLLKTLVEFVSGDKLEIAFFYKKKNLIYQNTLFDTINKYECNSLISGGLDSFCGSYNNYSNNIKSIYTSYQTSKFDITPQRNVLAFIQGLDDSEKYIFKQIPLKKVELKQRTRSLLFLALAVTVAHIYAVKEIRLYENGILSLNPSIDARLTTKTTHPKTIWLFNRILALIGIDAHVINPFVFKTKGQIINDLSVEFKRKMSCTTTCGTSKISKYADNRQCGWCIPCILRKISLSAYNLEEFDRDYKVSYGSKVEDIGQKLILDEYRSSLGYFQKFKKMIDNEDIYYYLDLRSKYYSDRNYLELTRNMLTTFSYEVERYMSKYALC